MKKTISLLLAICLLMTVPVLSGPSGSVSAAATDGAGRQTIYAGWYDSAAIKTDGSLWIWGDGMNGALGQGTEYTTSNPNIPLMVLDGNVIYRSIYGDPIGSYQNEPLKLMDDVASVKIGSSGYSYAIKTDGTFWLWGRQDVSYRPYQAASDVIAAEISNGTIAIIKSDHSLWMKGRNNCERIPGASYDNFMTEDFIKVMDDVASVHLSLSTPLAYFYFAAAIKTDGSLWTWGAATPSALRKWPEDTPWQSKIHPEKVMDGVAAIRNDLLLKTDGTLWDISGDDMIKVMDDVRSLSCSEGNGTKAAVKNDGSLWIWGNVGVKAGDGTCGGGSRDVPYKVMDDVVSVSLSDMHVLALKSDGTLWGWGNNQRGQLLKVCDSDADIKAKYGGPSEKTIEMTHQHTPVKLLDGIALPGTPVTGAAPSAPATPSETLQPSSQRPIPFTDVKESDYYYDSVVWAYTSEPQITDGTTTTTFSPDNTCTRGQVMTFLWRAAGCPEPETKNCPFADVKETDYFYKPVLWAVENKITDGTSSDTFSPGTLCANSHILTFIYRAVGEPGKTGDKLWYGDALNWAEGSGLLDGTYSGGFDIKAKCPRCNAVEYLYRYLAEK